MYAFIYLSSILLKDADERDAFAEVFTKIRQGNYKHPKLPAGYRTLNLLPIFEQRPDNPFKQNVYVIVEYDLPDQASPPDDLVRRFREKP